MKFFLFLFSSLSLVILLTACETTDPQNNYSASSNQDVIELQNDVAVLKRQMANSKTNNMRIMKHISSLQSQINYVNEHNQQQNRTINNLNQQIAKERVERKTELNKAVESIADQTTKAVNAIARQSRSKAVKTTKTMPAGAYYKHKVEPGETLSAIARAYKVSVKDIKQANNLKSNVIRVRQILHIPKK